MYVTHSHGSATNGVANIRDWPDASVCMLTVVLINILRNIHDYCNKKNLVWGSNDGFILDYHLVIAVISKKLHVATRNCPKHY